MSMDQENAEVLRPLLQFVAANDNEKQFHVPFRQAGDAILLGAIGIHSQPFEEFVRDRFEYYDENYRDGHSVQSNICEGILGFTVTKNNRKITKFSIEIRFDNTRFGPRQNVNYEFKEAVSNALGLLQEAFNYSANLLENKIAWTVGNPLRQ